ncbi:MAG: hypothetical protein WC327_00950 [Candidatus Cloacimonadia bacterium]
MKIVFDIYDTKELADGSVTITLIVKPELQVYLGSILESLDGYCYHTMTEIDQPAQITPGATATQNNIKRQKGLKITTTKGFYEDVMTLLNNLQGYQL